MNTRTKLFVLALVFALTLLITGLALTAQYPMLLLLGIWGALLGGFELWQWIKRRQTLSSEFVAHLTGMTAWGLVLSMVLLCLHLLGVY